MRPEIREMFAWLSPWRAFAASHWQRERLHLRIGSACIAIFKSGAMRAIYLRIIHSIIRSTQTRHLRRGNQFVASRRLEPRLNATK
jgi:hypothetical protein